MSIGRSSLMFSLGTILSRFFGLARESVVAAVFGAGPLLDAFLVANRIPNMLRDLLAEGALGSSFTKVYSSLATEDQNRAQQLFHDFLLLSAIFITLLCLLGGLFAPTLIDLLTLRESIEDQTIFKSDAITLTRILFPFMIFMTIGSVAQGVLHQKGRFFQSAVAPIFFSMSCIIGALIIAPAFDAFLPSSLPVSISSKKMLGFATAVVLGGLLQTLWQLRGLWTIYLNPPFHKWRLTLSEDSRNVIQMMIPMIIAASSAQINILVNTNFATSLSPGSVSWLALSFRLIQLPVGIIAVAIASASLPLLTKAITTARKQNGTFQHVSRELQISLELVFWLITPCFCFMLVNTKDLVNIIYRYGQFSMNAYEQTASALFYYCFALYGYGLIKVLTSYYYARDRTSFAMKVSLFSVLLNFALNTWLVPMFDYKALAITASLVLITNGLLLLGGLLPEKLSFNAKEMIKSSALLLGGSAAVIGLQLAFSHIVIDQMLSYTEGSKTTSLFRLIFNGIIVVIVFGSIVRFRTNETALSLVRNYMKKKKSS